MKTVTHLLFIVLTKSLSAWPLQRVLNRLSNGYPRFMSGVRSLSVSFFIEKEPRKQLRMKRKRRGER